MKRVFISDNKGGYKAINQNEIVDIAKSYLLKDLKVNPVKITSNRAAVDYLQLAIGQLKHEVFSVMYLTNTNELIDFEIIATGTINKAAVFPRQVLKKVMESNAAAVLFSHNHPSGNPTASLTDIDLTLHLINVLDLIEVRTLDHIIVTENRDYFSFAEHDMI